MTLQKKVYEKQALGIVGEFADNSPARTASYILKANGDAKPVIGNAFTAATADNEVAVGGSGAFAGIAIAPKGQVLGAGLQPSLELANGVAGEICSMGHVYVLSNTEVKPNYIAAFNPADGSIYAYATAEAAETAKHTVIPNAKFVLCSAAVGEVAVLELNP